MYHFKRGFTLIELLVVLVIIALMLSLTAPLTIRSVESFKAKNELSRFVTHINVLKEHAFFAGGALHVALRDNQMETTMPLGKKKNTSFQYLRFPEASMLITPVIERSEIELEVYVSGQLKVVTLKT